MFNYEGYKEPTPNPATYTVPDEAQLRGDFSNLRNAQGQLITIYDPATGRLENGQWVRDPFPNNMIPANRIDPMARAASCSISCGRTRRAPAGRSVAQQLLLRAEPRVRRLPATSRPRSIRTSATRRGCSSATPTTSARKRGTPTASRPARRRTASCRSSASTTPASPTGCAIVELVARSSTCAPALNQYLELARSDPGLALQPVRARVPAVAGRPAAEQGVPAHQFFTTARRPSISRSGANSRNSETTTGFSLQPNFSWTQGPAQHARRPRHADDLVHARDQQQPVRDELRPPLHAARLQLRRRAERQRDRVVPARRGQRRRSTTTSTRRSAGTTTRPGSRTTGG